jgi:hypothetical protein
VSEAAMLDGTEDTVSGTDNMRETDANWDDENIDMDIDETTGEKGPTFRHNALVVATFPWASGIVMALTFMNAFDKGHFGYVS